MAFLRNNPQAMQALQQGMGQGGAGGFGVPGMNQVQLPPPGGGSQGYGNDMVAQPIPGMAGGQQLGNKPMPLGGGQDPRFANKPMPGGLGGGQVPVVPRLDAGPALSAQVGRQPGLGIGGEKPMPTDPRFDPAVVANKPMPAAMSASQRAQESAQGNVARQQGMQADPAYQRQQNALAQAAGKPLPFGQGNPAAEQLLKPGFQVNPVEGPLAGKPPAVETPGNPGGDPAYTKPKPKPRRGEISGGGAGRRLPMAK